MVYRVIEWQRECPLAGDFLSRTGGVTLQRRDEESIQYGAPRHADTA